MRDYYEILDIARDASPEDIKKAYRKKALHFHPDRNPDDKKAEERFKEAAEAYSVLADDEKRALYDRFGHDGVRGNGTAGGPQYRDVSDIMRAFGDVFSHAAGGGSPFSEFFGGAGSRSSQRTRGQRGEDLRLRLKLTLAEIANGVDKKVKVPRFISCNKCQGTGAKGGKTSLKRCATCQGSGEQRQAQQTMLGRFVSVQPCRNCRGEGQVIAEKCPECWGEGRVEASKTVSLKVPSGVRSEQYITLRGEGNAGKRGGPPGNLRVVIKEVPSEEFRREGDNLFYELYISFPDAALGTEVEVPTLQGKTRISIKPGTQSGEIICLRRKGILGLDSSARGDLLINVNVWTPKALSREDRKVLESLRDKSAFTPDHKIKGKRWSLKDRMTEIFT